MKRHRLTWLFFSQRTNLFDGTAKKMLHVAPEVALRPRLEGIPNLDYLSADLQDPNCLVKMDVTDIRYPDNTFDVIFCSHVLEHVLDDRKAIREFARVLKPGGWAVFQVPLSKEQTIEDPSITSPAERERLFGQHDHVRQYGPDLKDRLEEGFKVAVLKTPEIASTEDTVRMGLPARDSIFFCVKNVI
jgi:SAM-dependent methyltransferase